MQDGEPCRTATIRDSGKEKASRPDNHNHCPSLFCLPVGSAVFQCSMSTPRKKSVSLRMVENHLKQGPVLPKTVIAEKCMNPSECKDLREEWPSWCVGGSFFSVVASSRACRHSCSQAGRSIMAAESGSTGPSSGAYTLKPHHRSLALKTKKNKQTTTT